MMMQAALLAWILAVPLYPVTKWAVVIAHEGGHAMAAVALLQGVQKITFDGNGGGVTYYSRVPLWPFSAVLSFAGYAGPSLFGLLAAWLLLHREPEMVLWASMAFLVVMLLTVRGFVGWVIVPALLVLLFQIATKASPENLTLAAYVWTWLLLISAVQQMFIYVGQKHYLLKESDTAALQRQTMIPGEIWSVVLLLGTGAALVWGGSLLLRMPA